MEIDSKMESTPKMEVPTHNVPNDPNKECTSDSKMEIETKTESDSKMEVPAHNVSTNPNEKEIFSKLYNNLEEIIWILKVKGITKRNEEVELYFTGFTVSKEKGLVMTATHSWSHLSNYELSGRRLKEDDFKYTFTVTKFETRWDIALLEVDGKLTDGGVGEFANSGSLKKGDLVMTIAHPKDCIGSVTFGKVCFPCIDIKADELPSNKKTCGTFVSNAYDKTPEYRRMGHLWNYAFFKKNDQEPFSFEKHLHPDVPIIQCNGLSCYEGSVGGPIFNVDGKIVGMVTKRKSGYDIGINVCLLCHFLSLQENSS